MTMVDYKDIWIYFLVNHKKIFNQSKEYLLQDW